MQASAEPTFRQGQPLNWREVTGDTATLRGVEFLQYSNETTAVVRFGGERLLVPLSSLSPMEPAKPPWFIGEFQKPRPAPKIPSEQELHERLAEAREVLGKAHTRAQQVQDKTTAARQISHRAARELEAALAARRTLQADDRRVQVATEEAIRLGQSMPIPANGVDRGHIEQQVSVCEQAQRRFDAELATCNASLADALNYVRRCASGVIGALIERETECLRALEIQAALARAELTSVASWWPDQSTGAIRLGNAAAQYLGDPQPAWQDQPLARGGSERRTQPWKELYSRLLTDADADFELGD
jgi:hypothetical protein